MPKSHPTVWGDCPRGWAWALVGTCLGLNSGLHHLLADRHWAGYLASLCSSPHVYEESPSAARINEVMPRACSAQCLTLKTTKEPASL